MSAEPTQVSLSIPLNKYIDHAELRPDATELDIRRVCTEGITYDFASIFVNPFYVRLAREVIGGRDINVGTVIAFPFGAVPTESKVFQTWKAILEGANEIDMVMNIGAAKSWNWELVRTDIAAVVDAARPHKVKVIIETCLLTEIEKRRAALVAHVAGAAFVKTSTGLGKAGATVADVRLIREVVGPNVRIKASGGIHNYTTALALIRAGADRIGTSAGVTIMEEYLGANKKE